MEVEQRMGALSPKRLPPLGLCAGGGVDLLTCDAQKCQLWALDPGLTDWEAVELRAV